MIVAFTQGNYVKTICIASLLKKFLKRRVSKPTQQLLYIYISRLVFIPYFKIVANRNRLNK